MADPTRYIDPAKADIAALPRERLVREALRAHEALMRYGKHEWDCPQHPRDDLDGPCDCGLDAACYSPFVVEDTPLDVHPLTKAIQAMSRHAEEHPSHGHHCACKDKYLTVARRWYNTLSNSEKNQFHYLSSALLRSPR